VNVDASPEELFESVVEELIGERDVTRAKMFGAPGLKVGGKFFATLFKGALVVKLPREQVDVVVASGQGEHFDPGLGRVMKEWVSVRPSTHDEWLSLAEAAKDFIVTGR
jgi:hypothetical protein